MENNEELDFEIVDTLDEENETDEDTNEQEDGSDENLNNTSEVENKKNPSNFKKLAKAYKGAEARIKELEAKLASGKKTPSNNEGNIDQNELRFFMIENPEAKEYKNQMREILETYPIMSLEDALELAKAKAPKQSTDKDDFSFSAKNTKVKKRLEDLSLEEALKLDNKTYFEWTQKTKKTSASNNDVIWGNI